LRTTVIFHDAIPLTGWADRSRLHHHAMKTYTRVLSTVAFLLWCASLALVGSFWWQDGAEFFAEWQAIRSGAKAGSLFDLCASHLLPFLVYGTVTVIFACLVVKDLRAIWNMMKRRDSGS
jgi:hypothetical protein